MEYRTLGKTDIKVSVICLGTMTWGQQNTESEAFDQLDYALSQGVNFIDTAELYPIPPRKETYAATERIIGRWLQSRGNKSNVILASKVTGPSEMTYMRGQPTRLTKRQIETALEESLRRLNVDSLDLYQLHWPDRNTNYFGRLGYTHQNDEDYTSIEETLDALGDLVQAGKVRQIGLSNETPWGTMRFLAYAEKNGLPRMVSIQNPYNLLNRSFEIGLAEIAHRERVGLLAYSPLGFGVLSGKYLNHARPEGARLTLFENYTRYTNSYAEAATEAYVSLAQSQGLKPAQMALAYVNSRSFLTSNIIGATTMEQLKENIESASLTLSKDVLEEIEKIHKAQPNPCP